MKVKLVLTLLTTAFVLSIPIMAMEIPNQPSRNTKVSTEQMNSEDVNECYQLLLNDVNLKNNANAEKIISIIRRIKKRSPNYASESFTKLVDIFRRKVKRSNDLDLNLQLNILSELEKIPPSEVTSELMSPKRGTPPQSRGKVSQIKIEKKTPSCPQSYNTQELKFLAQGESVGNENILYSANMDNQNKIKELLPVFWKQSWQISLDKDKMENEKGNNCHYQAIAGWPSSDTHPGFTVRYNKIVREYPYKPESSSSETSDEDLSKFSSEYPQKSPLFQDKITKNIDQPAIDIMEKPRDTVEQKTPPKPVLEKQHPTIDVPLSVKSPQDQGDAGKDIKVSVKDIVETKKNVIGNIKKFEAPLENFEDYFKKIIQYSIDSALVADLKDPYIYSYSDSIYLERTSDSIEDVPQKLVSLSPSLLIFFEKMGNSEYSYLEILFLNNLGSVAEEICANIRESNIKLPKEYEILCKINHGESLEVDANAYSSDFINLAYKVANNVKNVEMVKKLYPLTGVAEKEEALKKSHPEIYKNYIHEPYWSYNLLQLKEYGDRIINKISPYFVNEDAVLEKDKSTFVISNDEEVRVRKVPFGYVLTNIYLKKCLADKNDASRAVPRIFIVPKGKDIIPKGKDIKFQFKMPYTKDGYYRDEKRLETENTGKNALEVLSNDFIVYQEHIPGSGKRGDRRFMDLGHRDFNAVQIIDSEKDHKAYLVDTKEQKNFFAPVFAPNFLSQKELPQEYTYFCDFPYQDYGIQDEETYRKWKQRNRKVVYDAKTLNFEPRIIYVDVNVHID